MAADLDVPLILDDYATHKAGATPSAMGPDSLSAAALASKWGKPHVAAQIEQR